MNGIWNTLALASRDLFSTVRNNNNVAVSVASRWPLLNWIPRRHWIPRRKCGRRECTLPYPAVPAATQAVLGVRWYPVP
eukprot:SAG31_NODE_1008_length_10407_cov_2.369131_8_plen_79_part_00